MCPVERQLKKRKRKRGKEKFLQLHLTDNKSFLVEKKVHFRIGRKPITSGKKEKKARCVKEFDVKKCDGQILKHIQKHLRAYRTSTELVFKAHDLWQSRVLSSEQIANGLWRPFPLYNLCDKRMQEIINNVRETMEHQDRVIIPSQLLGLAVLNIVDIRLSRTNTSRYFKTKHIGDLSMGRCSYALRILRSHSYIEAHGHCWHRTDKEFDEKDFWVNKIS